MVVHLPADKVVKRFCQLPPEETINKNNGTLLTLGRAFNFPTDSALIHPQLGHPTSSATIPAIEMESRAPSAGIYYN